MQRKHLGWGISRVDIALVEVLVGVACVAVLGMIVASTFIERHTAAEYAQVKRDLDTLKRANEAYFVDYGEYVCSLVRRPMPGYWSQYGDENADGIGFRLTTPVAYLDAIPGPDPFKANVSDPYVNPPGYTYINYAYRFRYIDTRFPNWARQVYVFSSLGPNKRDDGCWLRPAGIMSGIATSSMEMYYPLYDPTNGTISKGDIAVAGGVVSLYARTRANTLKLYK